jgi:DUF917 family protein
VLPNRQLSEADLEALAIGAAILGTGGGGNPYLGKLRARELLRQGKRIEIVRLEDLPPDALVVSVGGIGAPVIGIEKIERGDECYLALKTLEAEVGQPIQALIAAEIGGANSVEPMIAAALAGIPVVDADGMGRAFPEVQMCTFFIYGHAPYPAALADDKGNRVVIKEVVDMYWLERFARSLTVDMGAAAGFALPPMRADFLQRYAVPGTVTQAVRLGYAVLEARLEHRNPASAICDSQNGSILFSGKILDVRRELKGGFAVGEVHLEGLDAFKKQHARIAIQNENLVFWRDGEVEVCVPDLITVLDLDTGEPITTEVLRYGQRVAIIAMPCHPLLKTPEALAVVGPAAFGYPEISFTPLSERTSYARHAS